MEIEGAQMWLGDIWVFSPSSMELKHSFGIVLKSPIFFHLTLLRHQNIKMSICKLDKNDWGYAISVFLVPVRNE